MKDMQKKCTIFLNNLIAQPLCYAIKSPDMDLYDFGFGVFNGEANQHDRESEVCSYTLHATCGIKVIWRNGDRRIDKYYGDTPHEDFHTNIKRLIGLSIKRVALSEKNDLWLDLEDYWVVFVTFENGEESWRLFSSDKDTPHLVASDSWLDFED